MLRKRERNHMQKLSTYGAAKVQFEKAYSNIHMGLNASYSRAQTRMNQMVDKTYRANQGALLKHLNTSKFGDLLASGATGKSIRRFGLMEKAALGRFYATKQRNLTQMQYAMDEGTKLSRRKAKAAQENEFARVAFQPTEDVAPPIPVMQNVGLALFGDVLNIAGTAAGIYGAFQGSDSRLKKDIKKIGTSIDGHNIYKFKYLDDDKEWIGAMAEEVLKKKPSAVVRMDNGYFGVDYHQIDVEFKRVA